MDQDLYHGTKCSEHFYDQIPRLATHEHTSRSHLSSTKLCLGSMIDMDHIALVLLSPLTAYLSKICGYATSSIYVTTFPRRSDNAINDFGSDTC